MVQGWEFTDDFEDKQAMAVEISNAEAKAQPDWKLWEKAIEEELAILKAAGTWKLADTPPGANIVGSRWVF